MLPTPHFQVVFTLPSELRPLAFENQALLYKFMFHASSGVLKDLAAQRLGGRPAITAVLHTWTTELGYHPHVHHLISSGVLHENDERWIATRADYLFPARVMGMMFRGRMLDFILDALEAGDLILPHGVVERELRGTIRTLSKKIRRWVVHVEAPDGRPVEHVTKYLARYVKRVAISDPRIVRVTDSHVVFRSRHGIKTVEGHELVRRFLLHILPKRFPKVRHYGLYASSNVQRRLEIARQLLSPSEEGEALAAIEVEVEDEDETCPRCGSNSVRRIHSNKMLQRSLQRLKASRARGPP